MKKVFILLPFLLFLLTACGNTPPTEDTTPEAEASTEPARTYPASITKVFDAHGGVDAWDEFDALTFTMGTGDKQETQLIDLKNRRELIERSGGTSIGYDGEKTWVVSEEEFKGDPIFYRGLMFYFYAMPWVLSDPGIVYEESTPLVFDGETFPGIKISYNDGVGMSPKDNYFLHYDEKSGEMRWLGYTVTGRTGKVSDKISWINYPSWSDHGGVKLADSLVWYTAEENLPVARRNARVFSSVSLSKQAPDDGVFAMPEGAKVYE